MTKPTAPPKHLSAEARKLWRSVLASYDLEPRHESILASALEAHDRMRQAQALITAEGLTVTDRYGTAKAHPAVAIERDSRTAMLRAWREIGLDLEQAPTSRPPSRWKG